MGFYTSRLIVNDARRHEIEILGPHVNASCANYTVEHDGRAIRIGLKDVQGVGEDDATAVVAERDANGTFADIRDLAQRTELSRDGLAALGPYADAANVNLAIEYVWNKFLLSPLEAKRFAEEVGSAYIGVYFDVEQPGRVRVGDAVELV